MKTQTEIRQQGFDWDNVERSFLWQNLSKDFIRELVEYDPCYKTQLQHHLLAAFHGYASYPSLFYQNMYIYLKMGLAEAKELIYYVDRVYMMYREQMQMQQSASRCTYKFVDGTGRVLDTWVC